MSMYSDYQKWINKRPLTDTLKPREHELFTFLDNIKPQLQDQIHDELIYKICMVYQSLRIHILIALLVGGLFGFLFGLIYGLSINFIDALTTLFAGL